MWCARPGAGRAVEAEPYWPARLVHLPLDTRAATVQPAGMHTPGLPSQGFWRGVALEARHPGPRPPALRLLYAAALFAAAVLVRYGLDQIVP